MEQHMINATSTTLLRQPRDLWKSPRGTVLRIEALALVAIAFSFFLGGFGSCRRWSNRWIVQKGFLAAHVLSLSLGTYSIGLMQSSSVKSEMYPIWAVSLLTLFGCVDSITTYIGLDYKGSLLKTVFQLSLYCGYVLLMSISTISSFVGNLAIGVLCAVTFIKGFHRSLALVLPSKMRNMIRAIGDNGEKYALSNPNSDWDLKQLIVDFPIDMDNEVPLKSAIRNGVNMYDVHSSCDNNGELGSYMVACHDVCFAFSMSHLLQQRFLGLSMTTENTFGTLIEGRVIDYKWTMNVIEIELAFLYEIFFTGNAFLHYYQAKTASLWALFSLIGICFVGVATAIPGAMSSRRTASSGPGRGTTIIVDTVTADLVVTLVILVLLALLQLLQLLRCWTSHWARVAFACKYASRNKGWWWWMRLKALVVTRITWFDKRLWQDKLGQYSLIDDVSSKSVSKESTSSNRCRGARRLYQKFALLIRMLGLQYIGQVLWEFFGSGTSKAPAIRLHADVKASIADFLGQIKSDGTGDWSTLLVANGIGFYELPYTQTTTPSYMPDSYRFSSSVMKWHIATCYCELAEEQNEGSEEGGDREKNRRVALALSKYCAYLVVSVPELLPGPLAETRHAYDNVAPDARKALQGGKAKAKGSKSNKLLDAMRKKPEGNHPMITVPVFWEAVALGKWLVGEEPAPPGRGRCNIDRWELLALLWVQTLLYAAPYGSVEAHMQRLAQGGEFITHLWALLYHTGILRWSPRKDNEGGQAGEGPLV
ncbi:unnamed protein product [Urochloa humidicola]